MSTTLLGDYFDLHGGGMDLKFPHHENEIAQSCAACDAPFVHVWMHNGFVNIDDEKMSKSLGNFFTVRDVVKTLRDPEVLRFFLLGSHYRGPINYSTAQLTQADETLAGLYRALKDALPAQPSEASAAADDSAGEGPHRDVALAAFHAAMEDDFNTPEAMAVLAGVARELNTAKAAGDAARSSTAARSLLAMGKVLGILQQSPDAYLKRASRAGSARTAEGAPAGASVGAAAALTDAQIEELIVERRAARAAKNFSESDRIRDRLSAAGIVLEDKPGGLTEWRRA
jgi:cysteinyl-tRNA synthetase